MPKDFTELDLGNFKAGEEQVREPIVETPTGTQADMLRGVDLGSFKAEKEPTAEEQEDFLDRLGKYIKGEIPGTVPAGLKYVATEELPSVMYKHPDVVMQNPEAVMDLASFGLVGPPARVLGKAAKAKAAKRAAMLRRAEKGKVAREAKLAATKREPSRLKGLARAEKRIQAEGDEALKKLKQDLKSKLASGEVTKEELRQKLTKYLAKKKEATIPQKGSVVKARTGPGGVRYPKVYYSDMLTLKAAKDLPPDAASVVGKLRPTWKGVKQIGQELKKSRFFGGLVEPMLSVFERMGSGTKELLYRPVKEAEFKTAIENMLVRKKTKGWRKSLTKKQRKRIGIFAIQRQKRGGQILHMMNEKPVTLTKKELSFYKKLRGEFDRYWERINQARASSGKKPLPKVKNYFTYMRTLDYMDKQGINPVFATRQQFGQNLAAVKSRYLHRKSTRFQFEIPRIPTGGISVELDPVRVFERYAEAANRHINLSPEIARGRELISTAIKDPISGKSWRFSDRHPRAYEDLTKWYDHLAGQMDVSFLGKAPGVLQKGARSLSRNLTYSVLAANIRSALIQPTAFVNTFTYLGPRYAKEGINGLFSPAARKFAMENSKVLRPRQYDVAIRDAMEAVKGGSIGETKKALARGALKPLQILDMETARATWIGAYKYANEMLQMSKKGAANFADDTVVRTQASSAAADISPIQRSAIGKSISLFQTFVIQNWNFLTKNVLGINAPITNRTAFKRVMRLVTGVTLTNILYEDVMDTNSPFPTPIKAIMEAQESGEGIPGQIKASSKEMLELVPIVGGGLRYGSHPLGAGIEYVGSAGKTLSDDPMAKPPAEVAARGLGVPGVGQIQKTRRARRRGEDWLGALLGTKPEPEMAPEISGLPPVEFK